MAGAQGKRFAFAPQCGHFFVVDAETISILSNRRPHLEHSYSYKGTEGLPFNGKTKTKSYHAHIEGAHHAPGRCEAGNICHPRRSLEPVLDFFGRWQ